MKQGISVRAQRVGVALLCVGVAVMASATPEWRATLKALGYYDADLSVQLLEMQQPVTAGDEFEFVVEVANQASNPAEQVAAIISLPQDYSFVGSDGCAHDPGGFPVCELGQVDALSLATFSTRVTVDPGVTVAAPITVVVTSATSEGNPGDETLEFTPLVARVSDLTASVVNNVDLFFHNSTQEVSYTLRIGNSGPSDAEDVFVTFVAPIQMSGIEWVCFSSLGASCDSTGTGAPDEIVVLQAGAEVVYRIDGILDVSAEGEVVAEVFATPPSENIDPELLNNFALDIDSITLFSGGFESQTLTRRPDEAESVEVGNLDEHPGGVAHVEAMIVDADDRPIGFWMARRADRGGEVKLVMTDPHDARLVESSEWFPVRDRAVLELRREGSGWAYRVLEKSGRAVSGTLEAAAKDRRRSVRIVRMGQPTGE